MHSQNTVACCCFIIFFIILNLAKSEVNIPQTKFNDANERCVNTFNENGSYFLDIPEDCHEDYNVTFEFEKNTSIINLTTSIKYSHNVNSTENSSDIPSSLSIKLYEFRNKDEVLLKEWHENANTTPSTQNYLSQSSKILLSVSGNWKEFKIELSVNEIEYRLLLIPFKPKDGRRVVIPYRPNSVSLLQLQPTSARRGVKIWFDKLHINTEMDEYLLIGPGTVPFEDNHERPLYVTLVDENSKFFVDNPSAFVAFVTGSGQKAQPHFEVMWEDIYESKDIVVEDPLAALNSSSICFYNYSAAENEFRKEKSTKLETFRKKFAETAQCCLPQEYKSIKLNESYVDLFGNYSKETIDGFDVLSILIRIMYKQKSIFTWRQLQSVIEKFEQKNGTFLGYKVSRCPIQQFDLPYKDEWRFTFYAMLPICALFALLMWAWKQNLFSQNCLPKKEEKLTFGNVHAESNVYVTTTVPKVYRFNEDGRRETWIHGPTQQEDKEETKHKTTVEMNFISSNSHEQDTLSRFLSSRKSKSRPSIQSLLDNTEEINKQSHHNKIEGAESDHLYDSVSSSKDLNETKL